MNNKIVSIRNGKDFKVLPLKQREQDRTSTNLNIRDYKETYKPIKK